jgi:hypothetical protein
LRIAVWGFTSEGRQTRELSATTFQLIGEMTGQSKAFIHEGGTIICPYGSSGLFFEYRWQYGAFSEGEGESLTKKYSQL